MTDSNQEDKAPEAGALLGKHCVSVHHGMLWIDAGIAKILGLSENQVLPETNENGEKDNPLAGTRPGMVVLTPIVRVRPSRKWLARTAAAAAAFALLFAFQTQRLWSHTQADESPVVAAAARPPAPTKPAARRPPAVQVQRDAGGVLVDISGPDASSVLDAFCGATDPTGARKPIRISAAPGQGAGAMLGHFEDASDPGAALPILIYFDPRTRRWRTGGA